MRTRVYILYVLLFGLTSACWPLDPHRELSKARLQGWDARDGMNAFYVHQILQTSDGYLWLATDVGLIRFDGVSFTVFDRSTVPVMKVQNLSSLAEGPDGTLWIGSRGGGIIGYRNGIFFESPHNASFCDGMVLSLLRGAGNDLWVGMARHGIGRIHGEQFTPLLPSDSGSRYSVHTMLRGRNDKIWFGMGVLGVVRRDKPVLYPLGPSRLLLSLCEDRDGTLWVGKTDGLGTVGPDSQLVASTIDPILRSVPIRALLEDRDGNLWIGTEGEGLFRYAHGTVSRLTMAGGLRSNRIECLFEDREGNLWIGTRGGGLCKLSDPTISMLTTVDGLPGNEVSVVFEDANGNRWVGTRNNGLGAIAGPRAGDRYDAASGLPSNTIRSLALDSAGNLWVGTQAGVRLITFPPRSGKGRVSAPQPLQPLDSYPIRSLFVSPSGSVWIGTYGKGLVRFEDGVVIESQAFRTPAERGFTRNILPAGDGSLWVATQYGIMRVQDTAIVEQYSVKEGLSNNQVFALSLDSGGVLWIGTYGGGLCRLRNGSISAFTTSEGLFDDVVLSIVDDTRGSLWLGSNRGISQVDKTELDLVAAGKQSAVRCIAYGKEDGMNTAECNGGSHPPAERMSDGTLYFATMYGVAVVDPLQPRRKVRVPKVILEWVIADRETLYAGQDISLESGRRQFEVKYTGLEYFSPEKVRFRYRLEGLDEHWTDAGSRRRAFFTHVPPGRYRFVVSAANKNGVWSDSSVALSITVPPLLWETWWFRAAGVLAGAAGLLVFINRRERRIKEEEHRKASLRQQIIDLEGRALRAQMDPHFIFNSLNAIQECILSGSTDRACEYLSKFARLLRTILEHSGKTHVSLDREIEALRLYLELESLRFDGRFNYVIDVDPMLEREIFLVPAMLIQPFVENAIWHGLLHKHGDRKLSISLRAIDDCLVAVVEDNGIGRQQAAAMQSQRHRQHQSMGMRVTQDRLEILRSADGSEAGVNVSDLIDPDGRPAGTRVEITVPLSY